MSEKPVLTGTHSRVYDFLKENQGEKFTINEIAQDLELKPSSIAQALSLVRRLPQIYEKTNPLGNREFGFKREEK